MEFVQFTVREAVKIMEIHLGRVLRAYQFNRKPKHGQDPADCESDGKIGVFGEGAVAKYFNLFAHWKPGPNPDDDDLAGCEIRSTYYSDGMLIGYPEDPPDRIHILVYIDIKTYNCILKGWAYTRDIAKPENYDDHFKQGRGNCYAIKQGSLNLINSLFYDRNKNLIVEKSGQRALF